MATKIFKDKWDARETLEKEILKELLEDYLNWRPEEREDFFHGGVNPENYKYYIRDQMCESRSPSRCNCGERREDGFKISLMNRRGDTIITRYACICSECGVRGGTWLKDIR